MEIKDLQKAFAADASRLGDYSLLTKTELANGYCDADEAAAAARAAGDKAEEAKQEILRSAYHSALMLRYWYKIFEWMQNSMSLHLEPSDFVGWLADSFYVVFYYRVWRYENEAIVKHGRFIDWKRDSSGNLIPNKYWYIIDPNAPDKIINRCCGSMRGRVYQFYNKDKRRAGVTAESIESMIEEAGDSAAIYGGCYEDAPQMNGIECLISAMLSRGEYIEALIVDGIAYQDSFKAKKIERDVRIQTEFGEVVTEKQTEKLSIFDARKLVKHLTHIDSQFISNFCKQYSVQKEQADEIFEKLQKTSNPKLYKCIEKTLIEIRENPSLFSCIT